MNQAFRHLLIASALVLGPQLPAIAQDGMGRSPYVEPGDRVLGVLIPETNVVFLIDAVQTFHRNTESKGALLARRIADDIQQLASTTAVHVVIYGLSHPDTPTEEGVLVGPASREESAALLRTLPKVCGSPPGPSNFPQALRHACAWRPEAIILITPAVSATNIDNLQQLIAKAWPPHSTAASPKPPAFYCMAFGVSADQKAMLMELSKRTGGRYRNLPDFLMTNERDNADSNKVPEDTARKLSDPQH